MRVALARGDRHLTSVYLHPALSQWRALGPSKRAIELREGAFVLSEWRLFDRWEAVFASADAARGAIAANDIPWQPVKPVKAARWSGGGVIGT